MIDDQLHFKAEDTKEFIKLKNSIRPENNFFNSSITSEENHFKNRKPNSINTLGYDAFSISIKNPGNSVIPNSTKKATLRLKSSGDRYFMFMTAFNINVPEPEEIPTQQEEEEYIVSNETIPETTTTKAPEIVAGKTDTPVISNRVY